MGLKKRPHKVVVVTEFGKIHDRAMWAPQEGSAGANLNAHGNPYFMFVVFPS